MSLGSERGFALLITITLLAFLVVLLVGLAAYMRVETAIAGNTQRQTQARQNALMALDVALGQLQKYAGPDQRVTATADSFGGTNGTRHFTGVWQVDPASPTPTLLTWLVSGNELQGAPLSVIPTTAFTTTDSVELVGTHTSGTARDVVAKLQPVTTVGAPGVAGAAQAVIGRYAWWVGDQGVKAPVALGDPTATASNFAYAPYDSAEVLSRVRQQISLGAGAADASGNPVFEPRDAVNSPLVANQKVTAYNQLAFLRNASGTAIGLTPLKTYYHAWSPNNFAVLANTKLGGLRQDLSLFSPSNPSPLGAAYDAWANYDPKKGGYMEDITTPGTPLPLPTFTADPIRRRYKITSPISSGNIGVAPVLTYFEILFGVRKQTMNAPYTLSLRWAAALWNPYTSALAPEDLKMEVSGLPESITFFNATTLADDITVNLRQLYGQPLKVTLPWTPSSSPSPDEQSWLPGRIYNWVHTANGAFTAGTSNPGRFNSRDLGSGANGLLVSLAGSPTVNGNTQLALRVPSQTKLVIKLERLNGEVLATYTSPTYDAVPTTTPVDASNTGWQLGFLFRLAESVDTAAAPEVWLTTAGRDPRSEQLSSESLIPLPLGTNPAAYNSLNFTTKIRAPERLLDRDVTEGTSYNEDVPLFELPRAPILSLGELQHFYLSGARPFSIGNSWGSGVQLNGVDAGTLFDRYFFSGLAVGVAPLVVNGSMVLPNPLLKALSRAPITGTPVTVADLQAAPGGNSSKLLLQGGAFNLNSTAPLAWEAVLRSVRFSSVTTFTYLNSDPTTGTAADDSTTTPSDSAVVANLPVASFFRFPQSAQEVYKADDVYVQSTTGSEQEMINTRLFRRGMRTLNASEVSLLATKITDAIEVRHNASGPFRSIEDFIAPMAPGRTSLIEQAIADAGINASVAEFSSQWLTQGDIMTALAPVMFPRSDTFVIRTYGEAVNPVTGGTEGRAWCEATVQRVPEYFDPSVTTGDQAEVAPAALTSTLNQTFGRRFKIVSFRWLTRSDI